MKSFWIRVGPNSKLCVCVCVCVCVLCSVAKSCPTLCDPMDCSLPGSPLHGIFQARILEWVAIPSPGNFLTQGSNPHLLYWQADSLPLRHLGSRRWHEDMLGRSPDNYGDRWAWYSFKARNQGLQAPKARKEARKESSLVPLSLQREYGPADTLILDSGLQSSKKISVSVLCLWFFTITTLEN